MSSNKPIQGSIGFDGNRIPYPLHPGQQVTATLTLNQPADVALFLTCDGVDKAWDEGSGPSLWRNIKDPVAIETTGAWVFEIRRYSESDAPVGIGWTLRVDVQAAPVEPPLFHAAMITGNDPDMQQYAAKLQNIKSADSEPAAFAVDMHFSLTLPSWDASKYDLIIIGHDTANWKSQDIARLATRPLLLIGKGGRDFLYALKPELTGAIGETVGKDAAISLIASAPYLAAPYPITKYSFPDIYGKDIYRQQFGAGDTDKLGRRIVVDPWGMATVIEISNKIVFYGYPKVPDPYEIWGIGVVNAATVLAARGKA